MHIPLSWRGRCAARPADTASDTPTGIPTDTIVRLALAAGLAGALATAAPPATSAAAAATTLRPVDQAAKDPSFLRFRKQLQKIVARRDLKALRRHLHPNIQMSYGGNGNGHAGAIRTMRRNPKRWAILARILRHGGKFFTAKNGVRNFYAPYTFFAELPGVGPYDVVTVVGTRVNVRARPSAKAKVLGKLSHAVVRVDWGKRGPRAARWLKIKMPDGRSGYVLKKFTKSPVDYRAGFVKYKGRWVMNVFVAGD
jgi:hypothetical protein